ncbi:hypothetical protein PG985_008092 [Apiospora marii]|uniref:Uncharacterized protein n=1 Tax=Apiospora marii TaxID=335849 RepID=A0ABR1R9P2_9PEZI
MAIVESNELLLVVQLDDPLAETLKTSHFHILPLDKSELADMTVEEFSQEVFGVLYAIQEKLLSAMWKDPSRRDECQLRTLELDPLLHDASKPEKLWMHWGKARRVCLEDVVNDAAFRTWWRYWQRLDSTTLRLKVVTNWRDAY